MAVEITGSGYNSKVKLYNIHQGNGYFRKDTSTTHSQVKLLQSALTDLGYDTQGADGKYGNNTLAAVKKFQEANNLTADGLFGKNSLTALESILGTHLDPENCETASGSVTTANLTVTEYIQNLESYCNSGWKYGSGYNASKKLIDCAWYPYKARSDQGAHGCTTEYNCECQRIFEPPRRRGEEGCLPRQGEGRNDRLPRAVSLSLSSGFLPGGHEPVGRAIHIQDMGAVGQPVHKG